MNELIDQAVRSYNNEDHAECERLCTQILDVAPRAGQALMLRSFMTNDDALARAQLVAACRHQSGDANLWYNLGVELERRGMLGLAMANYRRALALNPLHHGALLNGTQMVRIHEYFDEALALSQNLKSLLPENPAGYTHEAISLQHLGRLEEADAAFVEAEARSDNADHLNWEHHFSLLARKMFAQAWAKYEVRFACGKANGVDDMVFELPRWGGTVDQHVLLYGEQGIGDQLMFACAISEMKEVCSRVSLAVSPILVDLFKASFPDLHVYPIANGRDESLCAELLTLAGEESPVDGVLPLGSLMTNFRNEPSDFDGADYLTPSQNACQHWSEKELPKQLANAELKVGICWASNPAPDRFHSSRRAVHKTMQLEQMAELTKVDGAGLVAITNVALDQFGPSPEAKNQIGDVSQDLTNLDRTAALLKELDLLITVDTGVAHLAGSLGVPVWILLHSAADARWGMSPAADSYWYNSAELFWQIEAGNWAEVIERVGGRLNEEVALKRSKNPVKARSHKPQEKVQSPRANASARRKVGVAS